MQIKFKKLHPDAQLPTKSDGNIGWDLYYCGDTVEIYPGEQKLLSTGLSWEPESGYHGLIWDRSGLAAKSNIHRLAGVIDEIYRGEIKVILRCFNNKTNKKPDPIPTCDKCGNQYIMYGDSIPLWSGGYDSPITIGKGDRIAQLIIQKEIPTTVEWIEELSETERGDGGFGSTGR